MTKFSIKNQSKAIWEIEQEATRKERKRKKVEEIPQQSQFTETKERMKECGESGGSLTAKMVRDFRDIFLYFF